jgi:hypothetical protein
MKNIYMNVLSDRISLIIEGNTGIIWRDRADSGRIEVEAEGSLVLLDNLSVPFNKFSNFKYVEPFLAKAMIKTKDNPLTEEELVAEIRKDNAREIDKFLRLLPPMRIYGNKDTAGYFLKESTLSFNFKNINTLQTGWWPVDIHTDILRDWEDYSGTLEQTGYICHGEIIYGL